MPNLENGLPILAGLDASDILPRLKPVGFCFSSGSVLTRRHRSGFRRTILSSFGVALQRCTFGRISATLARISVCVQSETSVAWILEHGSIWVLRTKRRLIPRLSIHAVIHPTLKRVGVLADSVRKFPRLIASMRFSAFRPHIGAIPLRSAP
jgi:hypothetical protein